MQRIGFHTTVQKPDGSTGPLIIRSYSKDEALDLAASRGITVLDIRSPREVARAGGFRLDRKALAEAIDFLGLNLPVDIRYNSRVGRVNGNYSQRDGVHRIMLKSYLTPAKASRVLWHELTHAMQAERDSYVGMQASSRRPGHSKRIKYAVRPIEVEAREYEDYAEAVPLCI